MHYFLLYDPNHLGIQTILDYHKFAEQLQSQTYGFLMDEHEHLIAGHDYAQHCLILAQSHETLCSLPVSPLLTF